MPRDADEELRLIFNFCHPELDRQDRIGLMLHEVCGLTYVQIARAFLLPTTTVARRLVAARATLGLCRERRGETPFYEQLTDGMAALYLLFNEGYAATSGACHVCRELCAEAIRLTRHLRARLAMPSAELDALLALMLLHHARRDARVDAAGDLVRLVDQDRRRWDQVMIAEGCALADHAFALAPVGEYTLQAAIAALHVEAADARAIDWRRIVALYDRLLALRPSPIVALNRAVAVSMSEGPAVALGLVELLGHELGHYHLWHATRAELLRQLCRSDEAVASYRHALALASNDAERRFLQRRLAGLRQRS
jgi:RNA polymerase sigma-70 factor (ECF subfamily)